MGRSALSEGNRCNLKSSRMSSNEKKETMAGHPPAGERFSLLIYFWTASLLSMKALS